ncbi:MAG: GNAT family N-acetyltransferase [Bacteroidia bacterium]|nr:GNAT family N-acetyltransferase [Bacteroidia bacterium]
MEVRFFTAEALMEWIDSAEYAGMPDIPISRIRAVSHIKNPNASKEDVLLICAFQSGTLTGYMGVLPDYFIANQQKIKSGWLSCLWVNPEFRGKGIARILMSAALEKYGRRVILTDFTHEAGQLYFSSGSFAPLIEIKGIRVYFKSDASGILPGRKPFLKPLNPLLWVADRMLTGFFGILKGIARKRLPVLNLRIESVKKISPETESWIADFQQNMLFRRNKTELEWIIDFPWVVQKKEPDYESKRYYFTVNSPVYQRFYLNVHDDSGQLRAFIVLVNRDGHLKVPYAYLKPDDSSLILNLILHYACLWDVDTITIFHPDLKERLRESTFPFIFRKEISKQFLITHELKAALKDTPFMVQAGDGDAVFT